MSVYLVLILVGNVVVDVAVAIVVVVLDGTRPEAKREYRMRSRG